MRFPPAAHSATQTYDGVAYSGGNGVTYSGFVNGENSSVLAGAIAYGGNSQGAVNVGTYTIIPSNQTSSNYAINFVNATLTLPQAAQMVVAWSLVHGFAMLLLDDRLKQLIAKLPSGIDEMVFLPAILSAALPKT